MGASYDGKFRLMPIPANHDVAGLPTSPKESGSCQTLDRHTDRLLSAVPLLVLALIAAAGLLYYPGTQYLTSDTQIYTPLVEHSRDSQVLANDPLVLYPHLGLSLYDESVNAIRWLTGCSVYPALYVHQVLFRFLQVLAGYLIAMGLGAGRWESLWIAAALQTAGFVSGPSVMVVEYDAVPRGYTLTMGLLAIACVMHGRIWLGSVVAGISLFFQAGMAYPFLACFGMYLLFGRREEALVRRLRYLLPILGSLGIVFAAAAIQNESGSASLALVPDWLVELHRIRASYNYPSTWHPAVLWVPVGIGGVFLLAAWRFQQHLPSRMMWFVWGTPLVGILSIPFAWFTMEYLRLFLMAQLQPARAVAFMYGLAIPVLLSIAVVAARKQVWLESYAWMVAGLSIPFSTQLVFFTGANGWPAARFRYLWVPSLALLALLVLWLWQRSRAVAAVLLVLLAVAPFVIHREVLNTNAFATDARNPLVQALAEWASTNTAQDAVFAFPGFGRSSQPGVFRSKALRAVYTDWKSGGQVNFSMEFAKIWWTRWNAVMVETEFTLAQAPLLHSLGIDYLVLLPEQDPGVGNALFRNDKFVAFRCEELAQLAQAAPVNQ